MNTGKKITKGSVIAIISSVTMVYSLIGTLIATFYSVNQSDDYSHAMEIGRFHEGFFSYLATSVRYMVMMYKGWAGNYFSMFLQGWLSPLNNGGSIQLKLVMFANFVIFFVVFIWLIHRFLSTVFEGKRIYSLVVISMVTFALMNYRCFYEVWYWFSGAVSYSFPLSVMFLSFILAISSLNAEGVVRDKKKTIYVFSIICAFLGAGGSLTLAGAGCYIALLLCIYYRLSIGKFSRAANMLFASFLVGSIINVVAPGNYVRAENTNLSLLASVKNTIASSYGEYRWVFHETNFPVLMIIAVIVGMSLFTAIAVNEKAYTIVSVLALLTPVVSVFPVVMGYGMGFLANRTQFVIDQMIYFSLTNAGLILGRKLAVVFNADRKHTYITLITAIFVLLCLGTYSVRSLESLRTLVYDKNGTFRDYNRQCVQLEEYFATCIGRDVVMKEEDVPQGPDNFSCFYLENGWVNDGIAKYYGMNSLTLE